MHSDPTKVWMPPGSDGNNIEKKEDRQRAALKALLTNTSHYQDSYRKINIK